MDKKKMKTYRDRLLERRESLLSQVTEAEMSSRERDLEATQDPADMAANAYTKELLISMSANDRMLLGLIDEALARVESGEYGECVNCAEPIQEKRLDAVPWARYCLQLSGHEGEGAAQRRGRVDPSADHPLVKAPRDGSFRRAGPFVYR